MSIGQVVNWSIGPIQEDIEIRELRAQNDRQGQRLGQGEGGIQCGLRNAEWVGESSS